MFDNLIAPNPRLNASRADGQRLISMILAASPSISANPRLYCNPSDNGWTEIPDNGTQDNSDLPGWANEGAGSDTLDSLGVPMDLPIYLQVYTAESGNFHDVADVLRYTTSGVMTLQQALS